MGSETNRILIKEILNEMGKVEANLAVTTAISRKYALFKIIW